jgi:hypothetical protein
MKTKAMVMALLFGAVSMAVSLAVSFPGSAQNALGGAAKTKQSTVGGVAKQGAVLGGAAKPAPVGANPVAIGSVSKPGSVTPASGSAANATNAAGITAKQNPPLTPPGKGAAVVTTTTNMKCAAGACVAKGAKP